MNMDPDVRPSEKELSKMLGRTVPSIASKKWKLKTDYKSKLSKLKNMKDQATQIAEKMKDFRAKQGWSQRKLVEESDISLSVINQLECKNYSSLNGPTVQKLMDYIDNYTPKEDTTEKDTGVVSSKKEVEKVAEQPKEKEVVDMPGESLNMLVNKLDAMTSQLERLNTNMEEMNKLHKDQFKKEKLFNEIKELAREVA
jgi:transcriptional regulator with XRE-family HTH domain